MSDEQKVLAAAGERLSKDHKAELEAAAAWIREADHVLICGGAGMSIGCGLNYTSTEDFKKQYPAMLQYGIRTGYETMGLGKVAPPELSWGFLAEHIHNMRYRDKPHQGYVDLLSLVAKKDYFVLVSNVDGLFERAGFDTKRIYTPQGDFASYQCLKPCSRETWPSKPLIDKVRPHISKTTQKITEPKVVPKCSKCGGPVMANVRGGGWFIHDHYLDQSKAFIKWVESTQGKDKKLVVVEIGAGFNTPVVTRFPCESVARWHNNGSLVRINLDRSDVPRDLARAVGLPSDGRPALALLRSLVEAAAPAASDAGDAKSETKTETKKEGAGAGAAGAASAKRPYGNSVDSVIHEREELRQRIKASGRADLQLEQWQLFEKHQGHFDWRQFMLNLARKDDDDDEEEGHGEAKDGHGHGHGAAGGDDSDREMEQELVAVEEGAADA